RAALEAAPKITDSLCPECQAHFDGLRARLDELGVSYTDDPTLVRGLDYYTRTAFEFIGPEENVNSTICGGRRYERLVGGAGAARRRLRRGHGAAAARDRAGERARRRAEARRLPRSRGGHVGVELADGPET